LSDRAANLEAIEERLKLDVMAEAEYYGGIILVQEEAGEEEVLNTWVAAKCVQTPKELWQSMKEDGYNVTYHRVPVSNDQSLEDGVLDQYASILAEVPTASSLVFNCGFGIKRTTFAMSVALLIRRKQLMLEGKDDPYEVVGIGSGVDAQAAAILRSSHEQAMRDRSLLRLMNVLQRCRLTRNHSGLSLTTTLISFLNLLGLADHSQQMVLNLLSSNPRLLENLRLVQSK
jgi:hypothetical protein